MILPAAVSGSMARARLLEHFDESCEPISCQYLQPPVHDPIVDRFALAQESRNPFFEGEHAGRAVNATRLCTDMRLPDGFTIRRFPNYPYGHIHKSVSSLGCTY
jgi:hypothetical protein